MKLKIDTCMATHVKWDVPTGTISAEPGAVFSGAYGFIIKLHGQAGHGSRPDLAHSVLDCFNNIYNHINMIRMKYVAPTDILTCSVGFVNCGTVRNIIPDELTFGAEYDFYEREDGYSPLCETYGLTFANTVDLDIGLKYQAIAQDEIDVMPIFTTDGQVSVSDLVILNDDLHFYPSYQCGNVVRSKILERYPQLRDVLGMVEGILSDRDMAHLNYLVESENVEPRDAARQYLQENGLITEEE